MFAVHNALLFTLQALQLCTGTGCSYTLAHKATEPRHAFLQHALFTSRTNWVTSDASRRPACWSLRSQDRKQSFGCSSNTALACGHEISSHSFSFFAAGAQQLVPQTRNNKAAVVFRQNRMLKQHLSQWSGHRQCEMKFVVSSCTI